MHCVSSGNGREIVGQMNTIRQSVDGTVHTTVAVQPETVFTVNHNCFYGWMGGCVCSFLFYSIHFIYSFVASLDFPLSFPSIQKCLFCLRIFTFQSIDAASISHSIRGLSIIEWTSLSLTRCPKITHPHVFLFHILTLMNAQFIFVYLFSPNWPRNLIVICLLSK